MNPGLVNTRLVVGVANITADLLTEFLSDYLVIGTELERMCDQFSKISASYITTLTEKEPFIY